jgi:ribosome-associated toxin RatA of RatAB toxin-antitoxin module
VRTAISIQVDSSARTVFDLARDVEAWPRLLPHYQSVTVQSHDDSAKVVDMRAVRRFGPVPVPVAWRSRIWSEEDDANDLRLRFVHIAGRTKGMDVTWHIRPRATTEQRCTVTIEHDFRRRLPLLGAELFPRIVDRLFVQPIAGRTLATFKRLAEQ